MPTAGFIPMMSIRPLLCMRCDGGRHSKKSLAEANQPFVSELSYYCRVLDIWDLLFVETLRHLLYMQ